MSSPFRVQNDDDRFQALLQNAGVNLPKNLSEQHGDLDRDLNFHPLHTAGNPVYVSGWGSNQPKILLNAINPPQEPEILNSAKLTITERAEFRRVVRANWATLRAVAQWYYGDSTASAASSEPTPKKKMNCPFCKAYEEVDRFTKNEFGKTVCPKCKKAFK
jgi:hypothetical protein